MNEEQNEKNTIKLKKDVIKNIAIVFLTIMLILTFFSNSIMNRSLPEVATKYVQSATITEKIRGTGVVEADDPYSVMVKESRKIASVAVKVGDTVTKDQVLFYLEDSDSEELEKAQKDLEDLIYKYTAGALTGEMSAQAYDQATTGQVSPMAVYEAQIEAAKARVKAAQDNVDSIARQQTVASGNTESDSDINETKLELEKAQNELSNAKAKYDEIKAVVDGGDSDISAAQSELDYAELEKANTKAKYESEQEKVCADIRNAMASNPTVADELKNKDMSKYEGITDAESIISIIFEQDKTIKDAEALNDWMSVSAYPDTAKEEFSTAYKEYMDASAAYSTQKAAFDSLKDKAKAYNDAKKKLSSAQNDYNSAKNKVDELQTKVSRLTNEKSENAAGNQQLISDLAVRKADADVELSKAKEAQAQLLLDISKTLDLANQNSIIRDQREKVEKLKADAVGAVVTAPVEGTVLSIAKKAGETTDAAEALATIQVSGKPMFMSIEATKEQASKVNIGDQATLQNSWYYSSNIMIKLAKITNDPKNPGKGKLLVFNVEGDVTNGESMSISIGQRSREYDKVVPNSAIREDNKGKFIYIIEEKGTPFGNRYKAKRLDVEVVVSDDTNTAINADIDSWVYVITTSDKPINSGQQVRLSDN
ncbi:MAG: HlyD family efflux transporter periplasmic adaptor subunit [Lachnospiraceae bacterium]|nr:HlyD family efflux transporter periplasmic adaptor subunit [Lachnospiraceae bacterium]